jgi:low temperature requirement protein LtrA
MTEERRTSSVELLWDLVFVFAVTQVSTLLAADLSWTGLGRAMLALALVWWAWSAFVWVANAYEPDVPAFRGVLFVAMILIFVAGLALPTAFDERALLFTLSYAGVRLLHVAIYADASRRGKAAWSAIAGFAITVVIGMVLLVVGALLQGRARTASWTAAALIDYAGPAWLTRERLRGLQRVAVAHFAERYSLFVIICLGESIVAAGIAAHTHALTDIQIVAAALAVMITVGLWWTYFDMLAASAEARLRNHPDPVLVAADAYSYIHLVLVAGIIIFAVGVRHAIANAGEPLATGARLALCGGVATYLTGQSAFRLRMLAVARYETLAAAAAAIILFAAGASLPGWVLASALAVILALLITRETRLDQRLAIGSEVSRQ